MSAEGKNYYFNSKTKESVWSIPKEYSELLERKRKRNENESNISTLNELFQSHKLNMPTTLAPGDSLNNHIHNYLIPTNMNPIATNSANLNTAKPSFVSIMSTSQEMDNKIRGKSFHLIKILTKRRKLITLIWKIYLKMNCIDTLKICSAKQE